MKRLEFNKSFGQFLNLASIELPSKIFYNYLKSSNEGLNQHYEECKSLDSLPNTDSKIIKICEKLVKYLKTNYEEENKGDLKDHHCNLLSHWIYEQLDKKINDSFHSIIPIYGTFQLILSNVFKDSNKSQTIKCLRDVNVPTLNNWKESKDLYDYCVDCEKIMELARNSYAKCKEYEEYIQKKSPLYDKFEELYNREYKEKNVEFYNKCKDYDPKKVILKLNCDGNFPEEARAKAVSRRPDLLDSPHTSGQNFDSTNTYGNVFLGVVVISMTSGILYKFTPLGRRLRNGLGWNNYTAGNLNDGENMLFSQTHEPFNPLSEEREHHIGYLPA
ncbi:unnamed protein product [Plasmodium vivax]|uniref:(malaria parasite P. vivax) hypothetical protein n=1 Tax=Plasmodium vivax TaxID=5855 RepID=A0A8S4H5W9_PLAVI|nr:unnamed protein product [Plasmodium vivax]